MRSSSQSESTYGVYRGRRSPIFGLNGAVATTQPLASSCGLQILQQGGNAADAAVAVAAALNVTEPTSTGIGGDSFCLYFDAATKTVKGINGSGRCPAALSIDRLRKEFHLQGDTLPEYSVHTVTVPGSAACWCDSIERFGKLSLSKVLEPAIRLAEEGFPVSPITAFSWSRGMEQLKNSKNANELLVNGRAPQVGEVMKNQYLANTFKELAGKGKKGFYEGRVAESIVQVVQELGGTLTLDDLKNHQSTFDDPISVNYKGVDVWEIPPNGQGITALMALNILEGFDLPSLEHNSPEYLHLLIEALRLSFADSRYYVADPEVCSVPVKEMISKEYAAKRRQLIDPTRAIADVKKGSPANVSNTVYFCVVDKEGNACSFINSNYMGFGTGIIPQHCGFTLQNRGHNFSLDPDHPNALAPNKRPYHTIIPGMATRNGELYAPFGVMGGFMQPQGHVQVLVNMIDFGMEPQSALDAARFVILDGTSNGKIYLEDGISSDTINKLQEMGHNVEIQPITQQSMRQMFGKGQIITRNPQTGVLWAGSDPRGDGQAVAY